jgi:YidC/Oxa1 family membrane protein insertase
MPFERRALIAICLVFMVLYVWQAFFVKPVPKTAGAAAVAEAGAAGAKAGTVGAASDLGGVATALSGMSGSAAASAAPVISPGASAVVSDMTERDVRIETSTVIAVFTNRGGRLKSWRLKRYADHNNEPLELVATELGPNNTLPFSLQTSDPAVTTTLNGALYAVKEAVTDSAQSPSDITFEYRDTAGLHAVKEFHLEPKSYVFTFHDTVTIGDRPVAPAIQWGLGLGLGAAAINTRFDYGPRAILSANGKEQRIPVATLVKTANYEDTFKFVGVEAHYFMAVAFEPQGKVKVVYQTLTIPPPAGSKDAARDLVAYTIDPGSRNPPMKFYAGPKDFDELTSIDHDLVRAVDFGIWSFIVVPLLTTLKWIYGYVHNYGWSIVLLTVIINIIIFPLRHKSVVAMRKMQEIQPETKAIQDRYAKLKATDPAKQKMNAEIMELYKQRGVNPASGCIPIILPFPLLFAFYSLLTTSIELRGAPFAFWIHDLSVPDPYYVFPILMGISQLWQQWIMPAAGVDPAQRKIMMLTPLIFMFLFISYPSGMAVYFLVTNVWAIGQQYFTNYLIGPPKIRVAGAGAAERRAKRVGAGKTDEAAKGDK